jgi:hypothetical protein
MLTAGHGTATAEALTAHAPTEGVRVEGGSLVYDVGVTGRLPGPG